MADYSELFLQDSIDKQMTITSDDGLVITNTELHGNEFELTETLCSENQLKFGACESSSIKFKISYVRTSLKNKWLTVKIKIGDNEPYQIGRYKVTSDVPTADREFREVEAYDVLHDVIHANVADWYVSVLPNDDSTVTLKQFRDSFFNYFGITQETVSLPQDNMIVEKTIDPSEISGKDVITCICEINGCFGHIGRDGKFYYIFLKEPYETLYPKNDLYPRDDLYPIGEGQATRKIDKAYYISASYEDYITKKINKLQIRQNENDIGAIVGTGDNTYIVEDNFLVYGKNANDLSAIAQILYNQINKVWYRPSKLKIKGNPTNILGDILRLNTKYEIIYTYILERSLRGIQALFDEINAQGTEYYNENLNSVNKSIIQLRGKTNELTRTVEETNSRITDVRSGLQSQITQTADAISSEVTRATNAEGNLSSQITQTADAISSKVSKGDVSSSLEQEADGFTISGNRIEINSTYFKLAADGTVTATNGNFSGTLTSGSTTRVEIGSGYLKFLHNYGMNGIMFADNSGVTLSSKYTFDNISFNQSLKLQCSTLNLDITSLKVNNLTAQNTNVTVVTGIQQIGTTILPTSRILTFTDGILTSG